MIRIPLAAAFLLLVHAPQEADVVGRALQHEIERTKARLKIEGRVAPYFVRYTVLDSDSFEVMGSFGAVSSQGGGRSRRLDLDVRVGDYALDNTNFGDDGPDFGALFGIQLGLGGQSLTIDDDYDALRHAVWLATDKAYKSAVEELEEKKAWLTENVVQDRPDDLAIHAAVVQTGPVAKLEIDAAKWTASVRRLSGIFREFPWIQVSFVGLWAGAENRWLSNSEGTRLRDGGTHVTLLILAGAQSQDGMKYSDVEMFGGRSARDLPSEADLEKALRSVADRLRKLIDAPPLEEEYRGPVLFEEQAAAEFFAQVLVPQMGNSHENLGADKDGMGRMMGNPWKERLGSKVAADSLTVMSDPTLKEFGGRPVVGGWAFDDDGVPAERVTVIEKGVLKTFCMSRIPTRHVKKSNGHARDGKGAAGPVVVQADGGVTPKALRERLIAAGKEEGLGAVYVVRRESNLIGGVMNPQSLMSSVMARMMGGGGPGLFPPTLVYRVSVADGSETLVRGARIGKLTLRTLRDIVAAGDDAKAHLVLRGASVGSTGASPQTGTVVAPSFIVKELEIEKPGKEKERPPLMKHPFFDK